MTNQGRGNLARAQAEAERQAARRESSKSNQLAEQMKQKYGKWTGEQGVWAKEVDRDDVDKHMSRTNVEPGSSYDPSTWVVNWVTRDYMNPQ